MLNMAKTSYGNMLLIYYVSISQLSNTKKWDLEMAPISNSKIKLLKMSQDFPWRLLLSWEMLFN